MYNKPTKEDSMFYTAEDSKEYLITPTGANDLAKNWIEDKLFISFIDMSKDNGK